VTFDEFINFDRFFMDVDLVLALTLDLNVQKAKKGSTII